MQAVLIFLVAVALLVLIGTYVPTKTQKTPQNDRQTRQGDTAQWIEEINVTDKKR